MVPWDVDGIPRDAQVACLWEATARKVGNVHRFADFTNLTYMDFLLSAVAIGDGLRNAYTVPFGQSIRSAVMETQRVVRTNTNIGIVLLLVPLAAAAAPGGICRDRVHAQLSRTTVEDTKNVYDAIRSVNPGGLGEAPEQDVRFEPTVTLLEAMTLATDRDLIARQYANGFEDVFELGVPAFIDALARYASVEAAVADLQLRWLTAFPDSLIARKNGVAVADDVCRRAADVLRLGGVATPEGRRAGTALDRYLRSDGNKLNPGTTADLIAACLFVALRENKVTPSTPFRWDAPDWLTP